MPVSSRIEPLSKTLAVIVDQTLSPAARSQALAGFARKTLADAQQQNRRVLGRIPEHRQTVDGVTGARLEAVRPDGRIGIEFEIIGDVLEFIRAELIKASPVDSGAFRKAHQLFADGREVLPGETPPPAEIYTFSNPVPYARKIEIGAMTMRVPGSDHVFERASRAAKRRFGNTAQIRFTFVDTIGRSASPKARRASRAPAITVQLR